MFPPWDLTPFFARKGGQSHYLGLLPNCLGACTKRPDFRRQERLSLTFYPAPSSTCDSCTCSPGRQDVQCGHNRDKRNAHLCGRSSA